MKTDHDPALSSQWAITRPSLKDGLTEAVISLADTNTERLGFIPQQALHNAIDRREVIAAIDTDRNVLGYSWFKIASRSSHARIHHVCVAHRARKLGVGRALVEEIKAITSSLSGISLRCRRDFTESCAFWQKMGFLPTAELCGRGRDLAVLTCYWFDHRQRDLLALSCERDSSNAPTAVLDANVFFDLVDPDATSHSDSRALDADWLRSYVDLALTDEIFNEINRQDDDGLRKRHRELVRRFPLCQDTTEEKAAMTTRVEAILGIPSTESAKSDHIHLASAAASAAKFFVTHDSRLLRAAPKLMSILELSVVTPAELILHIDEYSRRGRYEPVRLAGTELEIRKARSEDLREIVRRFLSTPSGEKKSEFQEGLFTLAGEAGGVLEVVMCDGEMLACIAGRTSDPASSDIVSLRVCGGTIGATLARHLVWRSVQGAVAGGRTTLLLKDMHCGHEVRAACAETGFAALADGTLIKHNVPGIYTLAQMRAHLDSVYPRDREPTDIGDLKHITEKMLQEGTTPEDILLLEKALFPAKVDSHVVATYLVPIREKWAVELFDEGLAAERLIPTELSTALTYENAYYKSAATYVITAPARVLWYVTAGGHASSVRACSRIDTMSIGPASQVFKEYQRLGVYKWEDVRAIDKGRGVLAFQFSATELLRNPVVGRDVLAILERLRGTRPKLTTSLRLREAEFAEIYRRAL